MKHKLTTAIFFNHCFDKRRFQSFLYWFFKKSYSGQSRLLKFLEKLKFLGFHSATQAGFSISIDDLKIPSSKSSILLNAENIVFDADIQLISGNLTIIERYQRIIEIWNRTSEILKNQVLQSFQISDFFNPVYLMAFSGARGNISQIRQLVGMRGLMADPQGQIIDFPIRSNFREGLTLTEYLISCSGARKGIVDTALRTAASGYLTRRLVDVAHHVIINQIDCQKSELGGARKGACANHARLMTFAPCGVFIEDLYDHQKKILSLQQRLVGRVLAETIISSETSRSNEARYPTTPLIIGKKDHEISKIISQKICQYRKKVLIRSPLTCQSSKFICQLCYGWNLAEGQLVSIGEAIGVLAAQSIGEPGTQMTMRTFHTGGIFTGVLMDQTYAPFSGYANFAYPCNGLLIRTRQGKIGFLSKNSGILSIFQGRLRTPSGPKELAAKAAKQPRGRSGRSSGGDPPQGAACAPQLRLQAAKAQACRIPRLRGPDVFPSWIQSRLLRSSLLRKQLSSSSFRLNKRSLNFYKCHLNSLEHKISHKNFVKRKLQQSRIKNNFVILRNISNYRKVLHQLEKFNYQLKGIIFFNSIWLKRSINNFKKANLTFLRKKNIYKKNFHIFNISQIYKKMRWRLCDRWIAARGAQAPLLSPRKLALAASQLGERERLWDFSQLAACADSNRTWSFGWNSIEHLRNKLGNQLLKNSKRFSPKHISFSYQNFTILYVRQSENVLKKQLIAELPFLENEKSLENEQEILSNASGEIYFGDFIFLEKTILDFQNEFQLTKNLVQGLGGFWILFGRVFQHIFLMKNSFFLKKLDLVDQSVPFSQIHLKSRNFFKNVANDVFYKKNFLQFEQLSLSLFLRKVHTKNRIINQFQKSPSFKYDLILQRYFQTFQRSWIFFKKFGYLQICHQQKRTTFSRNPNIYNGMRPIFYNKDKVLWNYRKNVLSQRFETWMIGLQGQSKYINEYFQNQCINISINNWHISFKDRYQNFPISSHFRFLSKTLFYPLSFQKQKKNFFFSDTSSVLEKPQSIWFCEFQGRLRFPSGEPLQRRAASLRLRLQAAKGSLLSSLVRTRGRIAPSRNFFFNVNQDWHPILSINRQGIFQSFGQKIFRDTATHDFLRLTAGSPVGTWKWLVANDVRPPNKRKNTTHTEISKINIFKLKSIQNLNVLNKRLVNKRLSVQFHIFYPSSFRIGQPNNKYSFDERSGIRGLIQSRLWSEVLPLAQSNLASCEASQAAQGALLLNVRAIKSIYKIQKSLIPANSFFRRFRDKASLGRAAQAASCSRSMVYCWSLKFYLGYFGKKSNINITKIQSIFCYFFFKQLRLFQNLPKNWARQITHIQPKLIHWKNLPNQKYIFLFNFITNFYSTKWIKRKNLMRVNDYGEKINLTKTGLTIDLMNEYKQAKLNNYQNSEINCFSETCHKKLTLKKNSFDYHLQWKIVQKIFKHFFGFVRPIVTNRKMTIWINNQQLFQFKQYNFWKIKQRQEIVDYQKWKIGFFSFIRIFFSMETTFENLQWINLGFSTRVQRDCFTCSKLLLTDKRNFPRVFYVWFQIHKPIKTFLYSRFNSFNLSSSTLKFHQTKSNYAIYQFRQSCAFPKIFSLYKQKIFRHKTHLKSQNKNRYFHLNSDLSLKNSRSSVIGNSFSQFFIQKFSELHLFIVQKYTNKKILLPSSSSNKNVLTIQKNRVKLEANSLNNNALINIVKKNGRSIQSLSSKKVHSFCKGRLRSQVLGCKAALAASLRLAAGARERKRPWGSWGSASAVCGKRGPLAACSLSSGLEVRKRGVRQAWALGARAAQRRATWARLQQQAASGEPPGLACGASRKPPAAIHLDLGNQFPKLSKFTDFSSYYQQIFHRKFKKNLQNLYLTSQENKWRTNFLETAMSLDEQFGQWTFFGDCAMINNIYSTYHKSLSRIQNKILKNKEDFELSNFSSGGEPPLGGFAALAASFQRRAASSVAACSLRERMANPSNSNFQPKSNKLFQHQYCIRLPSINKILLNLRQNKTEFPLMKIDETIMKDWAIIFVLDKILPQSLIQFQLDSPFLKNISLPLNNKIDSSKIQKWILDNYFDSYLPIIQGFFLIKSFKNRFFQLCPNKPVYNTLKFQLKTELTYEYDQSNTGALAFFKKNKLQENIIRKYSMASIRENYSNNDLFQNLSLSYRTKAVRGNEQTNLSNTKALPLKKRNNNKKILDLELKLFNIQYFFELPKDALSHNIYIEYISKKSSRFKYGLHQIQNFYKINMKNWFNNLRNLRKYSSRYLKSQHGSDQSKAESQANWRVNPSPHKRRVAKHPVTDRRMVAPWRSELSRKIAFGSRGHKSLQKNRIKNPELKYKKYLSKTIFFLNRNKKTPYCYFLEFDKKNLDNFYLICWNHSFFSWQNRKSFRIPFIWFKQTFNQKKRFQMDFKKNTDIFRLHFKVYTIFKKILSISNYLTNQRSNKQNKENVCQTNFPSLETTSFIQSSFNNLKWFDGSPKGSSLFAQQGEPGVRKRPLVNAAYVGSHRIQSYLNNFALPNFLLYQLPLLDKKFEILLISIAPILLNSSYFKSSDNNEPYPNKASKVARRWAARGPGPKLAAHRACAPPAAAEPPQPAKPPAAESRPSGEPQACGLRRKGLFNNFQQEIANYQRFSCDKLQNLYNQTHSLNFYVNETKYFYLVKDFRIPFVYWSQQTPLRQSQINKDFIKFQVIQKNFLNSLESQIFIRFFLPLIFGEVVDPIIKRPNGCTDTLLFTNISDFFSYRRDNQSYALPYASHIRGANKLAARRWGQGAASLGPLLRKQQAGVRTRPGGASRPAASHQGSLAAASRQRRATCKPQAWGAQAPLGPLGERTRPLNIPNYNHQIILNQKFKYFFPSLELIHNKRTGGRSIRRLFLLSNRSILFDKLKLQKWSKKIFSPTIINKEACGLRSKEIPTMFSFQCIKFPRNKKIYKYKFNDFNTQKLYKQQKIQALKLCISPKIIYTSKFFRNFNSKIVLMGLKDNYVFNSWQRAATSFLCDVDRARGERSKPFILNRAWHKNWSFQHFSKTKAKAKDALSSDFREQHLGSLIRGGTQFNKNQFNFCSGQFIAKTPHTLLFRKATIHLLNDQSILHVQHGDRISKNQSLCSVFYTQSKTGDIIQGIPKIEEIFEARKKSKYSLHGLPIFSKDFLFFEKIITKYLRSLQKSVVNNIQRIYCGQGIYISDKHIEIIVRQMTSNVLILESGQTGLLYGEIVALQWISRINAISNQIVYEPVLIGMTKTCLETSSFLSAASFQETTRILGRAALQNQVDFIRGLKQNVILGNLIPIGTGCF